MYLFLNTPHIFLIRNPEPEGISMINVGMLFTNAISKIIYIVYSYFKFPDQLRCESIGHSVGNGERENAMALDVETKPAL